MLVPPADALDVAVPDGSADALAADVADREPAADGDEPREIVGTPLPVCDRVSLAAPELVAAAVPDADAAEDCDGALLVDAVAVGVAEREPT